MNGQIVMANSHIFAIFVATYYLSRSAVAWRNMDGRDLNPHALEWSVLRTHPPTTVLQEEYSWYVLGRRLGELQSLSGCFGEINAGEFVPAVTEHKGRTLPLQKLLR